MDTKSNYNRIILLVSWLSTFFMAGTWLFIISIIHTIKFNPLSFGLSTGEGALIVILPNLSFIPISLISGPLIDRIGSKKIGIIGNIVYTTFGILRGFSDSFNTLAIFTILMGVGLGIMMPIGTKLIGYWFKDSEIGTANGIYYTASGFGIFFFEAISLPLILPLVGHWRNTFFFFGGLTSIALILWILFIKDYPDEKSKQFIEEKPPIKEALSVVVKNKYVWYVGVFYTVMAIAYYVGKNAYRLLFPIRTGEDTLIHLITGNAHMAMFFVSFISFGALCANISIPYLSDRLQKRKIFLYSSLLLMSISIIINGFVSGVYLWIFTFIFGFTVGIISPLTPTCIIEIVEHKHIATGIGLITSLSNLFVVILNFLFPLFVFDRFNPVAYLPLLILLTGLSIMSIIVVYFLPETAKKRN